MFGTLKFHLGEFLGCEKSTSGKILGHLITMSGKIRGREIPMRRKKRDISAPCKGLVSFFPIWEIHKENTTKILKQPTLFTSWELQNITCDILWTKSCKMQGKMTILTINGKL